MKFSFFPALTALSALLAVVFLSGCPQSKIPDKPPMVPQPKAALSLPGAV